MKQIWTILAGAILTIPAASAITSTARTDPVGVQAGSTDTAGFHPVRQEATTTSDNGATKQIVVACPSGLVAYAPGAKVVGGLGGVVITGMIPAADLTSVTVTGRARTGFTGAWSLTGYVVCAEPDIAPRLVAAAGLGEARANCPLGTLSYGTGFETFGSPDTVFVDEVFPEVDLASVVAHVEGVGPFGPAIVQAYAICAPLPPIVHAHAVRVDATSGYNAVSPKGISTVACGLQAASAWFDPCWVFAVGGLVEGSHRAFLDGLVPRDAPVTAAARAVLATPIPILTTAMAPTSAGGARSAAAAEESDDYSVTAYAVLIGSWY